MLKLAYKYFGYRYRQHRRKTSEKVVVETVYGPVRGVKRISCWDDSYYSFEKIPFAKPPVGELRFTEPQPPEPWTQILECTKEASQPVQGDTFGNRKPTGSEDCLYLSVYTKEINPSIPKPVMVWIHGGGFVMGSISKDMYCPDYLMSKDVVVVSVAYRVGLFGFISLKDPSLKIPGNAGLKDQILGLRWVQKNIAKFGGDPNNVTLFGESAGGASVSILAITEQTKGLYHKVIPMSGTSFCFWATPPQRDWAYRIAKNIGYAGPNTDVDVLKFLRSANCYKIAASDSKVVTKEESIEGLLWAMGPVIEPYVTEQCVIPEDPRLMARVAWTNDIPMMIGGTSREGIFVCIHPELNRSIYKAWKEDSSLILPFELQSGGKNALTLELGDRLRKEFFGDGEITAEPHIDISTYKLFWHAIHRTVQSRLKYANAPTYYYNYDFESTNLSLFQQMGATSANVRGVAHGDDLGALFLNIFVSECQPNSEDYKVIKKMVGMWTEFAKKSDPNCEEIKPVEWKPIDPIENPSKLLNISNELTFIDNPFAEKLKVWDSLYGEDELI